MFSLPQGLTEHTDLDQLKRQAKELLRAYEFGDSTARALTAQHFPNPPRGELQLTGAQLVVARHHGFESWSKLRAQVDQANLRKLMQAMERDDIREARALLQRRPELATMNVAGSDEHRVLHHAVLRRNEPLVRALISAGADAHQGIYPHRESTTAYVLAKERGYTEIVKAIEEEEFFRREKMSCPNATISPVQDAIAAHLRNGKSDEAVALLKAEPELARACDREGATPLHIACECGDLTAIDWLLEHGGNSRKEDLRGRTPLDRAVARVTWRSRERRFDFPEIARRLRRHGAKISPITAAALGDLEAIREIHKEDPSQLAAQYWNEPNPLSTAVLFGQTDAVQLLLDLGLDPDERVKLRNLEQDVFSHGNPLWLASAFEDTTIAQRLLEKGADPNGMVYAFGTPVDRAYAARNDTMKRLLARYGGKPSANAIAIHREVEEARSLIERNPGEEEIRDLLWSAACGGSVEIVRMSLPLLDWPKDHPGWHAIMNQPLSIHLHSPVGEHPECFDRSTYPECLKLILEHGVDINLCGKNHGDTLMHSIAAKGKCWNIPVMTEEERLNFARIALAHKPDLTIRDKLLRSTPLGWACRWGRLSLVELLLEHGADAEEKDAEPWATPMAWARKMGHDDIAAVLEARLAGHR